MLHINHASRIYIAFDTTCQTDCIIYHKFNWCMAGILMGFDNAIKNTLNESTTWVIIVFCLYCFRIVCFVRHAIVFIRVTSGRQSQSTILYPIELALASSSWRLKRAAHSVPSHPIDSSPRYLFLLWMDFAYKRASVPNFLIFARACFRKFLSLTPVPSSVYFYDGMTAHIRVKA